MTTLESPTPAPAHALHRRSVDPFDRVWHLLCSVKLAIGVITLITLATLVGTILPQAPGDVLASPLAMTAWLAKHRPKYGDSVELFNQLGLFNVFGSAWFRALLAFLCLEIVVCTLNRLPAMWKAAVHPRVRVARAFFNSGDTRSHLVSPLAPAAAYEALAGVLRRRGYRLKSEADGEARYLYAGRLDLAPLATFINHTGLVLILVGAVLGSLLGFREDGFAVPDGKTRAVGHDTGLVVLNEGFTEENWPETGRPKDYRSDIVLYKDGVEVARQTIRVNDPLHYNGINFHQSFFGNAVDLRVRNAETGEILYEDSVPLPYTSELYGSDRPLGTFSLLDGRVQVDVIGTAGLFDQNIQPGQVGLVMYTARMGGRPVGTRLEQNEPQQIGPLEFTFLRERQYAGLQVVYNPGVPIIWLACALVMIGILIVFWLPPRRLWAHVLPDPASDAAPGAGTRVLLRGLAPERAEFAGEFERLVAELRQRLHAPPDPDTSPGTPIDARQAEDAGTRRPAEPAAAALD